MNLHVGLGIFTGQVALSDEPTAGDAYRAIPELAVQGEQVGFDSMWMSEHHLAGDAYLPSPLMMLAAIATRTERVLLGTATVLAPFHNPIRLAEDASVVDLLSRGRLVLGLGLGWWDEEFRVFGKSQNQRVGNLIDAVEIVRRTAFGERFLYEGRVTSVINGRITPAPMRRIPVWLGGSSVPALTRAGRLGDGYIASRCSPDVFAQRLGTVDAGALEAGRPTPVPAAVLIDVWAGAPNAAVLAGVWAASDVYAAWRAGSDTAEHDLELPTRDPDEYPPLLVAGTPTDIVTKLAEYGELAGERDLTLCLRLSYPGVSLEESTEAIQRIGADVLPRLRGIDGHAKEAAVHGSS